MGNSALSQTYSKMKTITGNTVRFSLARSGSPVASHAEACAAIPFTIVSEPAARLSTGKAIPNTQNLYRSDNGECLGQHTPQFRFFQPCESLETLEKAREIVGGQWLSVTVNKGGRQLAGFIGLESTITAPRRGDKVGLSVGFFDRFDGNGRTQLQLFANVLACDNGMTRAESLVSFSEKHNTTLAARFDAVRYKLAINLQEQIAEMSGIVAKLDSKDMAVSEVETFARVLLPATDESDVSARLANQREAIVTGFSRGAGNRGQTRWDAFNAVTEFLDWQTSFRETAFPASENRFESLTTGNGARVRSRAMELLLN